jgi:hypothetical protein
LRTELLHICFLILFETICPAPDAVKVYQSFEQARYLLR